MSSADLVGPAIGGAAVLFAALIFTVGLLAGRYRRECQQLRARNAQLSAENDRWHEDFAAQAGQLIALRQSAAAPGPQSKYIDLSRVEQL